MARKGSIPWNKGKKGIYSVETLQRMRDSRVGLRKPNTKERRAERQRQYYSEKPDLYLKRMKTNPKKSLYIRSKYLKRKAKNLFIDAPMSDIDEFEICLLEVLVMTNDVAISKEYSDAMKQRKNRSDYLSRTKSHIPSNSFPRNPSHVYADTNYQKNREKINKKAKLRRETSRYQLLKLLGEKCKICGFDDIRGLVFDHIHGDGRYDRGSFASIQQWFTFYISHPIEAKKTLQILCANCNTIKFRENREYLGYKISN